MTVRHPKPSFARRPGDLDAWVRTPDRAATAATYTARLTIDVTPALRGRIKIVAFGRGLTASEMLRALLEREFPSDSSASESTS